MVVDGYNWFGTEPGYVDPPFQKYEGKATVRPVVAALPTALGSYADTARIFAIRPEQPVEHDVAWADDGYSLPKFPPIRGGVLTPPFVYATDPSATFSLTVYKRVGRGVVYPYNEVRKQMAPYEPVPPGIPITMSEAPETTRTGPKKSAQMKMASFATDHRYTLPKYVPGTKTTFVLPKRRKAKKAKRKGRN